jgi:hypothetical protein
VRPPAEDLDPKTGATITRVGEPLLYYSEDPARAANARDYLEVAPLAVNQSGRRTWWVWLALLSTIDRGVIGDPAVPEIAGVQLLADGEPLELDFAGAVTAVPGLGRLPYAATVPTARIAILPLTPSQVERLARARQVQVHTAMKAGPAVLWLPWPGAGDAQGFAAVAAGAGR